MTVALALGEMVVGRVVRPDRKGADHPRGPCSSARKDWDVPLQPAAATSYRGRIMGHHIPADELHQDGDRTRRGYNIGIGVSIQLLQISVQSTLTSVQLVLICVQSAPISVQSALIGA